MKRYDYICRANGQVHEAEHPWTMTIQDWGQLCLALNIDRGGTSPDEPVEKLLGAPTVLTSKPQERKPGPHAMGCGCGSCSPAQDASKSRVMQAAKAELRKVVF
jgi:hypothetical protein